MFPTFTQIKHRFDSVSSKVSAITYRKLIGPIIVDDAFIIRLKTSLIKIKLNYKM